MTIETPERTRIQNWGSKAALCLASLVVATAANSEDPLRDYLVRDWGFEVNRAEHRGLVDVVGISTNGVIDASDIEFLKSQTHLRHLEIHDSGLSDEDLTDLVSDLLKIESLCVARDSVETTFAVNAAKQLMRHNSLKQLALVAPLEAKVDGKPESSAEISLDHLMVEGDAKSVVALLNNVVLSSLSVRILSSKDEETRLACQAISRLRDLRRLRIAGPRVDRPVKLANDTSGDLKSIEAFELDNCEFSPELLRPMQSLRHLKLVDCKIRGGGLAAIVANEKLTSLTLRECSNKQLGVDKKTDFEFANPKFASLKLSLMTLDDVLAFKEFPGQIQIALGTHDPFDDAPRFSKARHPRTQRALPDRISEYTRLEEFDRLESLTIDFGGPTIAIPEPQLLEFVSMPSLRRLHVHGFINDTPITRTPDVRSRIESLSLRLNKLPKSLAHVRFSDLSRLTVYAPRDDSNSDYHQEWLSHLAPANGFQIVRFLNFQSTDRVLPALGIDTTSLEFNACDIAPILTHNLKKRAQNLRQLKFEYCHFEEPIESSLRDLPDVKIDLTGTITKGTISAPMLKYGIWNWRCDLWRPSLK